MHYLHIRHLRGICSAIFFSILFSYPAFAQRCPDGYGLIEVNESQRVKSIALLDSNESFSLNKLQVCTSIDYRLSKCGNLIAELGQHEIIHIQPKDPSLSSITFSQMKQEMLPNKNWCEQAGNTLTCYDSYRSLNLFEPYETYLRNSMRKKVIILDESRGMYKCRPISF